MSASSKLVEYALSTFEKGVPEEPAKIVIQAIIDQYGLQIGGSEFPWSKSIYRYAKAYSGDKGNSTVTRYGDRLPLTQAAFVNSCFAHAQDFDDSHQEAQTHPGSVVIPSAIAVGEQLDLSGNTVLKAIVIGMEVMLRLAHSLCPSCIEGGHHTPPTIGPFGSAIACGLLLGLNQKQLVNALGICGSYSGGLVEYTLSGGSVKRIHTGLGARAGLEAALLAKEGLTGPSTIIDGDKGMWAVYGRGNAFQERLLDRIGEKYMLTTIMFKPYNCCYLIHPAIQGFLEICQKENIIAADIKSVTVGMSAFSISHAGKIMIPKDELGAQFSTSFTLALSLIKGAPGMWSYTTSVLTNKSIIALAKKITVFKDEEANKEFPKKNGCVINLQTKKGQNFVTRIKDPKGSPENQLTCDDVKQKFLRNVVPVLGLEQANMAYTTFSQFDHLDSVRDLAACFSKLSATKKMASL